MLALCAALVWAGGEYAWWTLVDHRLVTITPGEVYQSAEMAPEQLVRVAREHGIRAVIDLRDEGWDRIRAERDALERAGIVHYHVPSRQSPSEATFRDFLEVARNPANHPLLIHCEHGEGRSVLFAAVYRMEFEGRTPREAWRGAARLPPALRFLERLWPGLTAFGPDSPKGRILLGYQRRGLQLGTPGPAAPPAGRPEPVGSVR